MKQAFIILRKKDFTSEDWLRLREFFEISETDREATLLRETYEAVKRKHKNYLRNFPR